MSNQLGGAFITMQDWSGSPYWRIQHLVDQEIYHFAAADDIT
jgi:hypothetical protein